MIRAWTCGFLLLTLCLPAGFARLDALALESPAAPGTPTSALPDFRMIIDVHTRKVSFFRYMLPLVERENAKVGATRRRLTYIQDHIRFGRTLQEQDHLWLAEVVRRYRLPDDDFQSADFWRTAMARVDTIPLELVLVQAAIESAWGTSRFAREGFNFFGQWCFRPGCGMVPDSRPVGEFHEVARFPSASASIASYLHNLNSGYAYAGLREIRQELRTQGLPVEARALAAGLTRYSQRGGDYVDELRAMIRVNLPVIDQVRQDRKI